MIRNICSVDHPLRSLFGIGLLAWAVVGSQELHWLVWPGVVLLGTALFGFCPLYRLFGLSTCGKHSVAPRS